MSRRPISNGCFLVNQIPIRIMFHHVARRIPPIVEDLTPKYMPPNAPHTPVPLLREPLVPHVLRVVVVDLKGAVVNVRGFAGRHEEGVVVDVGLASVNVREDADQFLFTIGRNVEEVCWYDVESFCVPLQQIVESLDTESEVAQL